MMNNSIFWARLLGFYSVILSLWSFMNIKNLHIFIAELAHNHLTLITFGIFTLFVGLAIVISHSVWKGWPIIVTLVGYWILFKGLVLLFSPYWVNQIVIFWQGKSMMITPLPAMVIGLILLFCSYFLPRRA